MANTGFIGFTCQDLAPVVEKILAGYGDIQFTLEYHVNNDQIRIGIINGRSVRWYILIDRCEFENYGFGTLNESLHKIVLGGHLPKETDMTAAPFSLSEIEEAQDMIEAMK